MHVYVSACVSLGDEQETSRSHLRNADINHF